MRVKLYIFILFTFKHTLIQAQSYNCQMACDSFLYSSLEINYYKIQVEESENRALGYRFNERTNLNFEWGQINSSYYDNKFTINQNTHWPSYYIYRKKAGNENIKMSKSELERAKWAGLRFIRQSFIKHNLYTHRIKILTQLDSFYSVTLQTLENQYNAGAIAYSDYILISNASKLVQSELMDSKTQLLQIEQDLFSYFGYSFIMEEYDISTIPEIIFTTKVNSHAESDYYKHWAGNINFEIKMKKSEILPGFTFGISSMTMLGTGSDNITYDRTIRFNSIMGGIEIPIFMRADLFQIKALKSRYNLYMNRYEQSKRKIETSVRYQNAIYSLLKKYRLASINEKSTNSTEFLKILNLQLSQGEIRHSEFINSITNMLTKQLSEIKLGADLHLCFTEIQYLNQQ